METGMYVPPFEPRQQRCSQANKSPSTPFLQSTSHRETDSYRPVPAHTKQPPTAAFTTRRLQAPHRPGVGDRKGKKKATKASSSTESHGADPLEIAYGHTIGTHPQITNEDFEVDMETGPHRPQQNAVGGGRLSPGMEQDTHPVEEESQEEQGSASKTVEYGSAEDFQNIWGK
jgi:hypothetical protein